MKTQARGFGTASALFLLLLTSQPPGTSAAPLTLPFVDLGGYTTNQMTNYAASAAPSSTITSAGTRYYRGAFTPGSSNARLAIHSDDGSDVYVNGARIVALKGAGTHWQDLSSSLTILDYAFTNTGEYCVEIDFLNNSYSPGTLTA